MKYTGVILAGGLSTRMGQDKGLINYNGKAMVEYCIEALKPLCSEITISTNNPDYSRFGYKLIHDVYKEIGPIGGLHAALRAASNDAILVCPCDMPLIKSEDFKKIIDDKKESTAVVQSSTQKVYPTLGYYPKRSLTTIINQIEKKQYKLQLLLKELNAQYIGIDDENALLNFNQPEDLK